MNDYSLLMKNTSAHDLSMHANAIAMKYLTDDQLVNIAASSAHGDSSMQVCFMNVRPCPNSNFEKPLSQRSG